MAVAQAKDCMSDILRVCVCAAKFSLKRRTHLRIVAKRGMGWGTTQIQGRKEDDEEEEKATFVDDLIPTGYQSSPYLGPTIITKGRGLVA